MLAGALRRAAVATTMLGLVGCATADPNDLAATDTTPQFNRARHANSVAVDRNILRPAARAYATVTPTLFQHLIGNAFDHLELPGDFVNYMLQGEVDPALDTLGRFTLNTFLGAGGLLDPATEFGLPRRGTDFGVTLGRHGVPEGNFWVLPVVGPKTTRAAFGTLVDMALSPTAYLGLPTEGRLALAATEKVHKRASNSERIDALLYESADSYAAMRSAYLQRRRAQVAGGTIPAEAMPRIFEDEIIE